MKKILIILLLRFSYLDAQPFLLQQPKTITLENVEKLPRQWTASFCGKQSRSIFLYKNGEVAVQVSLQDLVVYESLLWSSIVSENDELVESESYFLGQVRSIKDEDNKPLEITAQEVANFIDNHKVLFYTGAGISLASGVADMNGLIMLLDSLKYVDSVKFNEQKVLTNFKNFCDKAFTAGPTPAHRAIAKISLVKKTQVLTENFDFLHQRSGIIPFCVSATEVHKNIEPEEMKDIDAIACVGMSADDRGLLQWYKEQNPQGKIIAFNLEIPQYLDRNDYVVLGDVQQTLPAILENIREQEAEITLENV